MTPVDLARLAVRVERLQRIARAGWSPADDLDFHNALPGGPARQTLPSPATLRAVAAKAPDAPAFGEADYRAALALCLRLEGLASRNSPRDHRRVLRDLVRGRFPR